MSSLVQWVGLPEMVKGNLVKYGYYFTNENVKQFIVYLMLKQEVTKQPTTVTFSCNTQAEALKTYNQWVRELRS